MDEYEEYGLMSDQSLKAGWFIQRYCEKRTGTAMGWKTKYGEHRFEYESSYYLTNWFFNGFFTMYNMMYLWPRWFKPIDEFVFKCLKRLGIVWLINRWRTKVLKRAIKLATEKYPYAKIDWPFRDESDRPKRKTPKET